MSKKFFDLSSISLSQNGKVDFVNSEVELLNDVDLDQISGASPASPYDEWSNNGCSNWLLMCGENTNCTNTWKCGDSTNTKCTNSGVSCS